MITLLSLLEAASVSPQVAESPPAMAVHLELVNRVRTRPTMSIATWLSGATDSVPARYARSPLTSGGQPR